MALAPADAEIVNDLGALYYHRGAHVKASSLFSSAIDLDSTLLDAKKNLADLHVEAGRNTEAETLYKEILSYHPDDPDAQAALQNLYNVTGRTEETSTARRDSIQGDSPTPPFP
jgi:Flp pilus assembly protein TadD